LTAGDDVAALRREPCRSLTYVAVALLLMTATLLARYIPARRISRVDPSLAMRAE
jgi:ABC-type lipoprotein release transport system permease subunit